MSYQDVLTNIIRGNAMKRKIWIDSDYINISNLHIKIKFLNVDDLISDDWELAL